MSRLDEQVSLRPGAIVTEGTVFTYGETGFWVVEKVEHEGSIWCRNLLTGHKVWLPHMLLTGLNIMDIKLDRSEGAATGC